MLNIPVAGKGSPDTTGTEMTCFVLYFIKYLKITLDSVLNAHMSFIWVAFFSVNTTISFNVPESIVHESTTAAMVSI